MARGRKRSVITIDGIDYWFSIKAFQKYFNDAKRIRQKTGDKYSLIKVVAEKVGVTESTVKGWKAGKHGSDLNEDGIKKLAELLHLDDYKKLLEPVEKDGKKGEDIKMANRMITDNERNAARSLYGEMCDMIKLCVWEPPLFLEHPEYEVHIKCKFSNQEEARYYYHDAIRKTALDLPKSMRDELMMLVDRGFGNSDAEFNEMYFNSDEYHDYLKKNDRKDNTDTRCLFSAGFIDQMRSELDRIFDAYIIK